MNEIFRRRLIGLAVLLVLVFILSLLLPKGSRQPGRDGLPTATVALDGAALPAEAGTAPETIAEGSTPPVEAPAASPPPTPKPAKPPATTIISPSVKPQSSLPAAIPKSPSSPAAKPASPPSAAVKPARTAEAAAASPKPAAGIVWYVQIGSYAESGNAQTTLSLLQNIGYRGESSKVTSGTGATLYRVRLGPFPTEAVARQALDKVSKQGYPQARAFSENHP